MEHARAQKERLQSSGHDRELFRKVTAMAWSAENDVHMVLKRGHSVVFWIEISFEYFIIYYLLRDKINVRRSSPCVKEKSVDSHNYRDLL